MIITPCKNINSEIEVPGDKSISHRAIILSSIANGTTQIDNLLMGDDCLSTIDCFRKMGIDIQIFNNKVNIIGKGLHGLKKPKDTLYVGNSGTTARLIMGILSGQNFPSVVNGDESIVTRPMKRVIEPLRQMGAVIEELDNDNFLPVTIKGQKLKGIEYSSPIASAQVKSCILLASLYADHKTIFKEPYLSRNHTELMLQYFGGSLDILDNKIISYPISQLKSQHIIVPGDISSAAFFIVLGLICPNSQITIKNVGINPTRIGILDILTQMGANIKIENKKLVNNESIGNITVKNSNLKGIEIGGEIIPRLIDEIPIITVSATQAKGTTIIKDANELKIKESNRISSMVSELTKMGANILETDDGMIINGPTPLTGAKIESHNDHRIAMSMAVAGKIAKEETFINNSKCVDISFPNFFEMLNKISQK